MPSNITRPEVMRSRPAIQRRIVVFPAPEGPNRIVMDAAFVIRTDASMRGPFSNCLTMSAISSKEPHLSIESVHNGKYDERNEEQHDGGRCGGGIVQCLNLII